MNAGKWLLAALVSLTLFALTASAQTARVFVLYDGDAADTTAVGMADSTSVLPTRAFQRLYLTLKPDRPCRVAIQVRKHGLNEYGTAAVLADTSNAVAWPWCKTAVLDSAGSWRETVYPTSVVAGSDEFVYEFAPDGAAKWDGPRGKYFAVKDVCDGEWYWARYTSIRLRVLSASGVVTWTAALDAVAW